MHFSRCAPGDSIELYVMGPDGDCSWVLGCCTTRDNQCRISKGWSKFVRTYGLQQDDVYLWMTAHLNSSCFYMTDFVVLS